MAMNKRSYRWFVVDVQRICIDSGWENLSDANDRATALKEETGTAVKVMTKPRIGFGPTETRLDPEDDASWSPKRSAALANPAEPLTVSCPICKAHVGKQCVGRKLPHDTRYRAASRLKAATDTRTRHREDVARLREEAGPPATTKQRGSWDPLNFGAVPLHEQRRHQHSDGNDDGGRFSENPGIPGGPWVEVGSLWRKKATDRHHRVYKVITCDGNTVTCEDVVTGEAFRSSLKTFVDVFTEGAEHATETMGSKGREPYSNPRLNPEPDSARAEALYETWHKKPPHGFDIKKIGVKTSDKMVCVGQAFDVTYLSGKWQKGSKKELYVHTFDSKPKVWMLASLVGSEDARGASKTVEEMLSRCCNVDGQIAVADLASPESFSLGDGEDAITVHRGAKVYGATDQKTVIIFDPKWKIIVVRGGSMYFDERGIVN